MRPRAVNFYERTYLVDGQQVCSIGLDPRDSLNNVAVVHNLQLPTFQEPTRFIKSFFWSGSQFLLVCQTKTCTIYRGTSLLDLQKRQTIEYNRLPPTDACFFAPRAGQLYLAISYSAAADAKYAKSHENNVPTIIYQWTDLGMIPVGQAILTPTVKSLATVQHVRSTIIFFALDSSSSSTQAAGLIYQLTDTHQVKYVGSVLGVAPITSTYSSGWDGREFFILTSDSVAASGVFLWDGAELKKVINVPEIQSYSLVNVVKVKDDTLMLVCNVDVLHIFQITNNECIKLMDMTFNSGQVVEINAWANETSLMLLIIKKSLDDTYYTELWNLPLYKEQSETAAIDETWKCLKELESMLLARMPIITDLQNQWPQHLPPSSQPINFTDSLLELPQLHVDGGHIALLSFDGSDDLGLFQTADPAQTLRALEESVHDSWSSSEQILADNRPVTSLRGRVVINGDAYIDKFYIDRLSVDYLNGERIDVSDVYAPGAEQDFPAALRAKNITIDNLEVSSLCGLDRNNWLYHNDMSKTRMDYDILRNSPKYNGTIFLEKEATLNELNANDINGINMKKFLGDVFIIGSKQTIKGNLLYRGLLQVSKLQADKINNIPSKALITRYSNQSLNDVYIDKLEVQDLFVETINGVPVSRAARISQNNVIKGKIIINNLIVTDEFIVDENSSIPFVTPTQIYDTVVVYGDVFMDDLEMDDKASLMIDQKLYDIHSIVDESWSKSKNQVLEYPVVFEKGISIDELSCDYLNGLSANDFLYVNVSVIDDLVNVTFSDFHFKNVVDETSGLSEHFLEETADRLTFKKPIRISHLSVDNISIDRYNGIPVDFIMQGNDSLKFLGTSEFEVIRVDGEMIVDEIRLESLNLRNASIFRKALMYNQNLEVEALKTDDIRMKNLHVKRLNGHDLDEALRYQENFSKRLHKNLAIDGDLNIEGSLQVETINDKYPSDYIEDLKNIDLTDLMENESIKNLTVTENLNVNTLNGYNVNDIFDSIISRSKKQVLHGEITIDNADIAYLIAKTINDKDLSELRYINEPCVFYGTTTFSDLFVRGDIITKTLNGKDASELQEGFRVLTLKNSMNLHIFGNISWENSSPNLQSLDYLLNNAVTTNGYQVINSPVVFRNLATIESLYLNSLDSYIPEKIREIISDAVVDDHALGSVVVVKGTKIFKSDLVVDDLVVTNNIDIQFVNEQNIDEVASNIFKKGSNDVVSADIIFLGPVEIGNLKTNSKIHGVPLFDIATYKKTMPDYLHFQHLVVEGNLTVFSLDDIQFDEFAKNRVTLNEDQEVFGDVTFEESVTVLNNTFVSYVNGIKPTNLVLNNAGIPSVIYGRKTFASDVVIEGDVETVSINNINVSSLFNNSVLSDENVNIHGDVVFESNVEALSSVAVTGRVNGLEPQRIRDDEIDEQQLAMDFLSKEESSIQRLIASVANSPLRRSQIVLYLEEDNELKLHLPGVKSLRSMEIESTTLLDVYATVDGTYCGLPCDCSCRRQFAAEIGLDRRVSIQQDNSSSVTFNFYIPSGQFGLKIISQAISSSEYCSGNSSVDPESSIILWIKLSQAHKEIQKLPIEISGFVADTQIFIFNDKLYLILAIFYNKVRKTHSTESLVYEFNLQTNKANLIQAIPTDGAVVLHIFQVTDVGVHVLIGCVKGRSESLLLRFDQESQNFQTIRTFATGGSKHVASVSRNDHTFVILNNPDIDVLHIFAYEASVDNFLDYQNLNFDSKITSLCVFYAGEFGRSDAFVVTTTKGGQLFVYEYMFYAKFQLKISHWIEDIQTVAQFRHMDQNYLLIGLRTNSTIFKVIQQGLN